MLKDLFLKRFSELNDESDSIPIVYSESVGQYAPRRASWKKWATSVESLLKAVFGSRIAALRELCQGVRALREDTM